MAFEKSMSFVCWFLTNPFVCYCHYVIGSSANHKRNFVLTLNGSINRGGGLFECRLM